MALIYREEVGEPYDIDVGELLRLVDYLQAHCYIDLFSDILRNVINIENCVPLYELSCMYNCDKLKRILVYFICSNFKSIIETYTRNAFSDTALASLSKTPSFLCLPMKLIGSVCKKDQESLDTRYMLMSYSSNEHPLLKSEVARFEDETTLCSFEDSQPYLHFSESKFTYFMFNHELYVISSVPEAYKHNIYKYEKHRKDYSMFIVLMSPLPEILEVDREMSKSKMSLTMVLSNASNEYILIFFHPFDSDQRHQWVVKVDMGVTCTKPSIAFERKIEDAYFGDSLFAQRSVYCFNRESYFMLNIDTEDVEKRSLQSSTNMEYGRSELAAYCQFQEHIYSLRMNDTSKNLTLYCFNTTGSCWDLVCQQPFEVRMLSAEGVSSPNELVFILEVNCFDFEIYEDGEDFQTFLYRFNPESKELVLHKKDESNGDTYLFVPEYIFE